MSALALQQNALLAALWQRDASYGDATYLIAHQEGFTGTVGLNAYKSNAAMVAGRALAAAYPVVAQLVGESSFAALARAFWHAHPPVGGDLAQWGNALPAFLASSEQLASEPYLGDVALAEWALHRMATAADAPQDAASLALLLNEDPALLRLVLAPGTAVFASAWPVASIVLAHSTGTVSLAQAGQMLQAGVAEDVLVWRQGFKPYIRACQPGEAAFTTSLLAGASLAHALDAAPLLDFNAWLTRAVPDALWISTQFLTERSAP